MLIKAASHLRPILRLPFLSNSAASPSPFTLPNAASTPTTLPPNAFTSNASLAAQQNVLGQAGIAANAVIAQGGGAVGFAGAQGGAGAGAGNGFHAGSSRFSGYTGYGRALIQANSSQTNATRRSEEDEEDNDLSNPNSRASLIERARKRRPSANTQQEVVPQSGRRGRRFNEAGANVRFIEVESHDGGQRKALSPAERARLAEEIKMLQAEIELLEESAIDVDDLPLEHPVLGRRSRSTSLSTGQAVTAAAPRMWTVGLGSSTRRKQVNMQGQEVLGVVRQGGPVRHMSVAASSEAGVVADAGLIAQGSASRFSPVRPSSASSQRRTFLTGRPRSQSTSALSATRPSEDLAAAAPSDRTKYEEEELTAELRSELERRDQQFYEELREAIMTEQSEQIRHLVNQYRNPQALAGASMLLPASTTPPYFTTATYNLVLDGLFQIRPRGGPISELLQTYNEMLERNVLPNMRTFSVVIRALLQREAEIKQISDTVDKRDRWSAWEQQFAETGVLNSYQVEKLRNNISHNRQLREEVVPLLHENNYKSAIKIFKAAVAMNPNRAFHPGTYSQLLEATAQRGDVASAVEVYAHVEKLAKTDPIASRSLTAGLLAQLLRTYVQAGDLHGAQEVFDEFKRLEMAGRLRDGRAQAEESQPRMTPSHDVYGAMLAAYVRCGQPAKAEALLNEMTHATAESRVQPGTPPMLTGAHLSEFIQAHLQLEPSGRTGGEQLLRYHSLLSVQGMKAGDFPSIATYDAVLNSDLLRNDLESACATFLALFETPHAHNLGNFVSKLSMRLTALLKLSLLEISKSSEDTRAVDAHLDTVMRLLRTSLQAFQGKHSDAYIPLETISIFTVLIERNRASDVLEILGTGKVHLSQKSQYDSKAIQQLNALVEQAVKRDDVALRTAVAYGRSIGLPHLRGPNSEVATAICRKYSADRNGTALDLGKAEWVVIMDAFVSVASRPEATALRGQEAVNFDKHFVQLASDLAALPESHRMLVDEIRAYAQLLQDKVGGEEALKLVSACVKPRDAAFLRKQLERSMRTPELSEAATSNISSTLTPQTAESASDYTLDSSLSTYLQQHSGPHPKVSPFAAYEALQQKLKVNKLAHPEAIGKLLETLSRSGEEVKVRELYGLAHQAIQTCIREEQQLREWLRIEDRMLIALCHLGYLEEAGLHRAAILEHGGVPSADAYSTMISCAKDTTDDASVARELFAESQSLGVKPHLYLYNTIISKLSKARKAESALELFIKMKGEGIRPSSVTYGAVINACCRVGDAESAATLFNEMQSMPNFKPRVPPYNTMMQLHLTTQPSRDLVLHYYNQMVQRGVAPSAHTYKLLLDAFGTLDPIDLPAMERVFANLCADPNLAVQGTHWTSLINAYGVVAGDVARAQEIFDSIATHPSLPVNGKVDPICWEAILSVFATHKLVDKMEEYWHKMQAEGVRGTAYINNMLIKGYANVGRIEDARTVFEGMGDQVTGVAAPNNHPTLLTSSGQAKPTTTAHTELIYREPSTYEMMIRAELLAGDREKAEQLCARMEERHYPVPVTARIRSVLHEPAASHAAAMSSIHRAWTAASGSTTNTYRGSPEAPSA